jgi:predicted translin family RNA/ssDNA-binding protein
MLLKKEKTLNINLNLDETLELLSILNKLYTEEEIFNLYYKSIDPNIREIIQLTRYLLETYDEEILFENFTKVECNFESLFKELLRIFYKLRNDEK